tara:strand:- start:3068 stop:3736 length:669 start_codon:yes stop_codon:yes gene_type:complete
MKAEGFVKELANLKFENTFNPYSDRCEIYDYFDAPNRRRAILRKMLEAASQVEVDAIWIGRDLGYRGGRRTGLALTDDIHFCNHVGRWQLDYSRLTKGDAVPERTAAVIWSVLSQISSPVFLWNVFPLHPFEAGSPFSNRAHNSTERKAGEEILEILVDFLKPRRLVAIGNDAESAANKFGDRCEVIKVRHPSYGGQNIFLRQVQSLYDIEIVNPHNMELFD